MTFTLLEHLDQEIEATRQKMDALLKAREVLAPTSAISVEAQPIAGELMPSEPVQPDPSAQESSPNGSAVAIVSEEVNKPAEREPQSRINPIDYFRNGIDSRTIQDAVIEVLAVNPKGLSFDELMQNVFVRRIPKTKTAAIQGRLKRSLTLGIGRHWRQEGDKYLLIQSEASPEQASTTPVNGQSETSQSEAAKTVAKQPEAKKPSTRRTNSTTKPAKAGTKK